MQEDPAAAATRVGAPFIQLKFNFLPVQKPPYSKHPDVLSPSRNVCPGFLNKQHPLGERQLHMWLVSFVQGNFLIYIFFCGLGGGLFWLVFLLGCFFGFFFQREQNKTRQYVHCRKSLHKNWP